jgi:DNA-binding NarL/FixJ family response regulator
MTQPALVEYSRSELPSSVPAERGGYTPVALAAIWDHLVSGRWAVVDSFSVGDRSYLAFDLRDVPGGRPRLTERQLEILERTLSAPCQKVVAIELGRTASTVAWSLAQSLKAMGFSCQASRVPSFLVAAIHAHHGATDLVEAQFRGWGDGSTAFGIASIPRPDLCLAPMLTSTEYAVARLLADGHSRSEIAALRNASTRTVANQVSAVFRKLGVSGRLELLAYAARAFRRSVYGD